MELKKYQLKLLALERALSAQATRNRQAATAQVSDTAGDLGDASVADEGQAEQFSEAELASATLTEVRDALQRIDAGTYGFCEEDGAPIPERRLDAVPWARLCAEHQTRLEAVDGRGTPSL
jgi:DnaK suppressor protein